MTIAPRRSAVGGVFLSPTNAVLLSLPETPPPEILLGCCVTWCRIRPGIAGSCSSSLDCNNNFVSGNSSQQIFIDDLSSTWSYKHFPAELRDADGNQRGYPWGCDPSFWNNASTFWNPGTTGWNYVPLLIGGGDAQLTINECGTDIGFLPGDKAGIITVPPAEWTIVSIVSATVIDIGYNRIGQNAKVYVMNNGPNDGEYTVAVDSGAGDTITLTTPLPDPATSGGKVLLKLAPYKAAHFYSAVADPPNDLYPAFMVATGDGFEPGDDTIRISGAAPYDGEHAISVVSVTRVQLLGVLFAGRVAPGGTWLTNKTIFVTPGGASYTGTPVRVIGTSGQYDGDYSDYDTTGTNPDVIITDLYFAGTDSGTLRFAAIEFDLGAGFTQDISGYYTIVVTGTGLYDGTYQDVGVVYDISQQYGIAFTGDLDFLFFEGDATGTLTIPALNETGAITGTFEAFNPVAFSAVEAEKSGVVQSIEPEVMRLTTDSVQSVDVNDQVTMVSHDETTPPYQPIKRTVRMRDTGYIDLDGLFTVTDAGVAAIESSPT